MFDVLVYLYENYWRPDACPDHDQLTRKLSSVGFESDEIQEALSWLDGVASKVKPRVLADYRANYRRYVAEPLGDKAVATINAADVRSFRAALMAPRPRPTHMRPKGIVDASAELVTLSRSTVKHATDTPRRILDVAVVDGAITENRERRYQYPSDRHPR